jgi:sugar lactone lactonase YvrE
MLTYNNHCVFTGMHRNTGAVWLLGALLSFCAFTRAANPLMYAVAGGARWSPPATAMALCPTALLVQNDTVLVADAAHFVFKIWPSSDSSPYSWYLTVYAGLGFPAFGRDEKLAVDSALSSPMALASSPDGAKVYIADAGSNRIRMVADGWITTVAGTGVAGYSGDGDPAVTATLNNPCGLVVAPQGALYIADTNNNVIRKVNLHGFMSTLWGLSAGLLLPQSMSLGSGYDFLVADTGNNRLMLSRGNNISTFLSPGLPAEAPLGMLTSTGVWWVSYACQVYNNASGIFQSFVGSSTCGLDYNWDHYPAVEALLNRPVSMVQYTDDMFWIADQANYRIRLLDTHSTIAIVSPLAGVASLAPKLDGFNATSMTLHAPMAVSQFELGSTVIADSGSDRIWKVDDEGFVHSFAGSDYTNYPDYGDGSSASMAFFSRPSGLAYAAEVGSLYISDTGHNCIRMIAGSYPIASTVIGANSSGPVCSACNMSSTAVSAPTGLAWDSINQRLYLADTGHNLIRMADFNPEHDAFIYTILGAGIDVSENAYAIDTAVKGPKGVAYYRNTLTYTDTDRHCIRQIIIHDDYHASRVQTIAGSCEQSGNGDGTVLQPLFNKPAGVAQADSFSIYVSDTGNQRVVLIDMLQLTVTTIAGSGPWTSASQIADIPSSPLSFIGAPQGLTVSDNQITIADSFTNRVWRVSMSPTPYPTRLPSSSTTPSPSMSVSFSGTISPSIVASLTGSFTQSGAATGTSSSSVSTTGTPSATRTLSLTPSPSHTTTPSATLTGTITPSLRPNSTHVGTNGTETTGGPVLEPAFADEMVGGLVIALCAAAAALCCCLIPCCFAYRRHVHQVRERNAARRTRKLSLQLPIPAAVRQAVVRLLKDADTEESTMAIPIRNCREVAMGGHVEEHKAVFFNLYTTKFSSAMESRVRIMSQELLSTAPAPQRHSRRSRASASGPPILLVEEVINPASVQTPRQSFTGTRNPDNQVLISNPGIFKVGLHAGLSTQKAASNQVELEQKHGTNFSVSKPETLLMEAISASLHVATAVTIDETNAGIDEGFDDVMTHVLEHTFAAAVAATADRKQGLSPSQAVMKAAAQSLIARVIEKQSTAKAAAILQRKSVLWPTGSEPLLAACAAQLKEIQTAQAHTSKGLIINDEDEEAEPTFPEFVMSFLWRRNRRRNALKSEDAVPLSMVESDDLELGSAFSNPLASRAVLSGKRSGTAAGGSVEMTQLSSAKKASASTAQGHVQALSCGSGSVEAANKLQSVSRSKSRMSVAPRALIKPMRVRSAAPIRVLSTQAHQH